MQTGTNDAEIQLSDPSCRILVVAPTVTQATSCIALIQNHARQKHSSVSSQPWDEAPVTPDHLGSSPDSELVKIPWMITNRYYSAPVHFAARQIHGLSAHQLQNIPAVIFVWSQGESYQHHVERISQDISGSGSEIDVCLAVRIEPQMVPHNILDEDKEEQEEDDTETDAFLSENGFEYIIATEERSKQDNQEDDEKDSWSEGIPGLSRVLDALSTIMWPSMQPRTKDNSSKKQERERALLDWAHSSQDNSLPIIDSEAATALSNQEYQRTRSMKLEMEELARWLDEDESLRDDPWKSAANSGALSSSPTIIEFGDATPQKETNEAAALGFDDDFTVFVSAPAIEPSGSSGRTTPDGPPGGLSVASMGDLYRSLGSVSDFGGSDDGRDGDLNDEDLPSKEEILATSSRIFGSAKLPLPPNIDSKSTTAKTGKTFAEDDDEALPSHKKLQNSDLDSLLVEGAGYDMEPFDLSKVLSALQEMKAEIASMEDEGERRKAAAKVALGLVYGLEADTETL